MAVEKLPSGGWRARWRDANGHEHSHGKKGWRKQDARKFERQMLNQKDQGVLVTNSDMTVADLAKAWISASRHLAPKSIERRQTDIDHIIRSMGNVKLQKLSEAHIEAHMMRLEEEVGLARSTQQLNLQHLSIMLNYAVNRRPPLLHYNPARNIRKPRVNRKEKRYLSLDELYQLANSFPLRWKNLILFTGIMGPRWGEVWDMRPEDISGRTVLIRGTKSKSSLRRITMPRFIEKLINEQLEHYAGLSSLWANEDGLAPNRDNWRRTVWKPSLKASGIPPLPFHDLRHTAAALAIQAGAHPLLIQRRLGHANINITLGTYGHLFPEADEEIAQDLDDMWEKRRKKKEGG